MMSYRNAFLGSLVADAVSMPVHWYYDVDALDRDYGDFDHYLLLRTPTRTAYCGVPSTNLSVKRMTSSANNQNIGGSLVSTTINF